MEDLEKIATDLRALRETLRTQMNNTSVPEQSDRLFLQILEISHRLQMINSIVFSANTAKVTAHLAAIEDATKEIGDAIADIDQLANVIGAVKNILGIVDGVIDLLT